jgi:photosystem II stability/assembly factor-like uncharacterized protein
MKNSKHPYYIIIILFLFILASSTVCISKTFENNPDWIDISTGIEGGPSMTLCFAPDNPDILYAGVSGKGVYKISNSGQSWELLDKGLDTVNSKEINVLKIDPVDSNIVFLGTGAGLKAEGGKWVVSDALYKSTDGGNTWKVSNSGIIPKKSYIASPPSVYDIAIDFNNHMNVYIATYEGIYKSIDGGINWNWSGEGIGSANVSSIVINPDNHKTLFASCTYGVYRSDDSGASWKSLGLKDNYIKTLAINPADKDIIYAGGVSIFRTTDGGKTWIDLNLKDNDLTPSVKDIEISSQNPSVIYLATNIGIFKSNDGGENWTELKPSKLILFWSSNNVVLSQDNVLYSAANGFSGKPGGLVWMWKEEGIIPPQENTGSIIVKTNLVNASFTITGPSTYQGTGTTYQIKDVPIGEYTATFNAVEGYSTPLSIRKTLEPGGTITFDANYSKIIGETTTIILYVGNPMMYVNGVEQEIDPGRGTAPVIISKWGRTIVPIRALVESLGGTISWDDIERKVTINFKTALIELQIDNPKARVNGNEKWIDPDNHDVRPTIINSRTMLPLRFVAESLGCNVDWDPNTKAITVTYEG